MNEVLQNWSSNSKELLEQQAKSMLKYLKENCSTYGELKHRVHKVKGSVLFQKEYQVLEPIFDILAELIENEKNALLIREGEKEETVSENEKFIRIKVSNVRFNDSCEQMKFNQMLIDCPDKAIDQIESLLEQKKRVLEISFD